MAIEESVIRQLRAEIDKLPTMARKVVWLIMDNFTTEEIMTKLDISQQNVLNQKARAIKLLRSRVLKEIVSN